MLDKVKAEIEELFEDQLPVIAANVEEEMLERLGKSIETIGRNINYFAEW